MGAPALKRGKSKCLKALACPDAGFDRQAFGQQAVKTATDVGDLFPCKGFAISGGQYGHDITAGIPQALDVGRVTNAASDRHVCYVVTDIAVAERHIRDSGVEIISDLRPIAGVKRFYVRDPGGNLLEITGA